MKADHTVGNIGNNDTHPEGLTDGSHRHHHLQHDQAQHIPSAHHHMGTHQSHAVQLARCTASPLVETPSLGAILDSCLARASTLDLKMDKLSAEVSARRDPSHPTLPAEADQQGGQGSSDKASNLELARDTSVTRKAEKHQTFDATEPASKLQTTADAMQSQTLMALKAVATLSSPAVPCKGQTTDNTRQPQALQVRGW